MINKIKNDLKNAMKNSDKEKLNPLRNLVSKIKMKEIEKGSPLNDEECLKVCISAAKQIKESIIQFEKGGRADLSENEKKELKIIEKYLPEQLSDEKILEVIKMIIKETGANSPSDMGKVMGSAMSKLGGQADGKAVQKIVMEELSK
tara:strand:- start:176 stop:616 length:441 start_codon:yes stop_codon:yes gene_type:complete